MLTSANICNSRMEKCLKNTCLKYEITVYCVKIRGATTESSETVKDRATVKWRKSFGIEYNAFEK